MSNKRRSIKKSSQSISGLMVDFEFTVFLLLSSN